MRYFFRVGDIPTNKSGLGARGYQVYRRGTTVRVVFGPIRSTRRQMVSFEWERTSLFVDYPHKSIAEAIQKVEKIHAERERNKYLPLRPGDKIARPAGVPLKPLKRTKA